MFNQAIPLLIVKFLWRNAGNDVEWARSCALGKAGGSIFNNVVSVTEIFVSLSVSLIYCLNLPMSPCFRMQIARQSCDELRLSLNKAFQIINMVDYEFLYFSWLFFINLYFHIICLLSALKRVCRPNVLRLCRDWHSSPSRHCTGLLHPYAF